MTSTARITLLLPLASCLGITLAGTRISRRTAGYVSTVTAMGAAVSAAVAFFDMWSKAPSARGSATTSWTWLAAGPYHFGLTLLVDQLSIVMMLIVAGVGSLIVAYSVGYMDGEDEERRFFAYMSLFLFSMLLLVEGGNLLLLLAGWGMVGLSSYLLIGYYQERESAIAAAKKAFVMNAFGDATMALALFLLVQHTGALDYASVFARSPHGGAIANLIALGLLGGALAKSAQIPLHTWLPDAMEGPTPVSALIHAATMVTAGVYLIVRTHAIYDLAPIAGDVVAVAGGATLLMAATVALVQEDIKRILAWSTVSQIGYMVMAAGLGIYTAAMFHFLTHAFFKALLFLAVGIVIHAIAGEQSIDKMGGLRRHLPFAFGAVLIGCLAIAGVPPFSGFFSKDEIIAGALSEGPLGIVLGIVAILAAGLTAFYMFRLLFRTFLGPDPAGGYAHTPHTSGLAMSGPVGALAVLAAVGGLLQVPEAWHKLGDWLHPVLADAHEVHPSGTVQVIGAVASLAVVAVGIGAAWYTFVADPGRRERLAGRFTAARRFLLDEWRFDRVYDDAVIGTGRDLGDELARTAEARGVQAAVAGVARGAREAGRGLGVVQSGLVRGYAVAIVVGAAVMGAIVLLAVR